MALCVVCLVLLLAGFCGVAARCRVCNECGLSLGGAGGGVGVGFFCLVKSVCISCHIKTPVLPFLLNDKVWQMEELHFHLSMLEQ